MEPTYILVFATTIITINADPIEETHVQVDLGRPFHRVYPGLPIQQNGQQLNGGHATGAQCVDACERDTQCGSVDYDWLNGYCLRFRNGFSDRTVQTGSDLAVIHVEVKPPVPEGEGGNSTHVSAKGQIAGWSCVIHLGYAYGYPYDQNHGRKIATKENVENGIACVRHCQGTRGCRAVNYRYMNRNCIMLNSGKDQDQTRGVIGQLSDRADYVHIELWNPITQSQQTAPGPNMALLMDQVRLAGQGTGPQMAHGMGAGSQTGQGSGTGRSMNQGMAPQTGRGSGSGTSKRGYARHRSSGGSK